MLRRLNNLFRWVFTGRPPGELSPAVRVRGPRIHVILLDGTLSSLDDGEETNVGLTYKLLREVRGLSLYYEPGIQWADWKHTHHVMMGRGINRQIRRAYGVLASRYRPGDKIFLIGYSRGAYAVRSLAGVIDRVGLLRPEQALTRNIRQVYRLYEQPNMTAAGRAFAKAHCHPETPIEALCCFDTVKSLGLRLPLAWRWTEARHAFHNHEIGAQVRHGFHALALDETREVFEPVMWTAPEDRPERVEQMWFAGTHGDIGGQLGGFDAARPLSHIPLTWMLGRAEAAGLPLPPGWQARFPMDSGAPSAGTWRAWGKLFLLRKRRVVGGDPTERIHPTAHGRATRGPGTPDAAPAPPAAV
ncbi:DUF2235 domain-containing protein [Mesobacterium pallidum]|uniref:DUF2235 domain-containing protein n=1 Tax=Mesobacterium pallidum TaxID=2872037 RepID=UPI001EE2546F|nr:DUF2235 domain-containing protein [Mesobacterium pallidum]